MLALLYLILITVLGDRVCRHFFSYLSKQQRVATAFLAGLLISGCVTYPFALIFSWTSQPLVWANLLFAAVACVAIVWLGRKGQAEQPGDGAFRYVFDRMRGKAAHGSNLYLDSDRRPAGRGEWDWLCLSFCFMAACWLMFSNLTFGDNNIYFAVKSWSDFGANLSVSQSFSLGRNFPSEHPFFPGEAIKYHFLFWFQAANLSFLGLNIVWSVNLLSILSLLALLCLIMAFAEVVFSSRPVARIAALLFFFASSSLSYIPFLLSQQSFSGAARAILNSRDFITSGYPFRGDDWGALSVAVFSNQRHLISGVGILFIVLIFLVEFYKRRGVIKDLALAPNENGAAVDGLGERLEDEAAPAAVPAKFEAADIRTFVFCGLLIGMLPYWNSAVFVSASIIIGSFLLAFPYRKYLAVLIAAAVVVGLPQVLMLRSGNLSASGQSLFHWGYTIAEPTIPLVIQYLGWTYGFKWVFVFAAIWVIPPGHRRLFLALSVLLPVVFLLQLSTDGFNNHKLLNIWNTAASVFIAYSIWTIGRKNILSALLVAVLTLAMVFGAVIDLFPLRNDTFVATPLVNDDLTNWVLNNTETTDIFLTNTLLSHPILFAGRKIYLGNTLFAWTAGYDLAEREKTHRLMFQETDVGRLTQLLTANNISFVAFDDGLRTNQLIPGLNEATYHKNFEKVFEDPDGRYANLTIYRVRR